MQLNCEYWEDSSGSSPIGDFLIAIKARAPKAVAKLLKEIELLEEKGLQFMMQSDRMDKFKGLDIYEVKIEHNKIQYRILGVLRKSKFYLLLGFIKKGQKTPSQYLDTAVSRGRTIPR